MNHQLIFPRAIRDPLYGLVSLTDEELRIVDHPLFRRLHRIRQNGLLYLIFPSATHTRFEHSVGVLHAANQLLNNLLRNSAVAAAKNPPAVASLGKAADGQAVNLHHIGVEDLTRLYRVGRVAALVHDLGHGPFSHHFEPFAPPETLLASLIESEKSLQPLTPLVLPSAAPLGRLFEEPNARRLEHEVMSCILFARIIKDADLANAETLLGDVAAVILSKPELCTSLGFRQFIPLLHDLIASAPADADRMDYLERDSRSCGVAYGLFDRPRLLKSFLAYTTKVGADDCLRLGLKASGIRAVENFIQARFELFVQVYYHKTNRAVQLMLERIAKRVELEKLSPFRWSTLGELVDTMLDLSDERFLNVLRGEDQAWTVKDVAINELAARVYDRKLWKRLYEGEDIRGIKQMLQDKEPTVELLLDEVDPKATKDLDAGARLLTRGGAGVYSVDSSRSWREASAIIGALAADEGKIQRIYMCKGSEGQYKGLREALWGLRGKRTP